MSGVLGWLSNAFSWLGNFLWSIVTAAWGVAQSVLDVVGALLVGIIGTLLSWVSTLLFGLLGLFTALLPIVERPGDTAVGTAIAALAQANRYVPVAEMLVLLPIWGAVFLGVVIYKAWKAVPLV